MKRKQLRVGVVGATGTVGQRLLTLLAGHPWFEVTVLAASEASAGKRYADAVGTRWAMQEPIPPAFSDREVLSATDVSRVTEEADLLFCAVSMPADETRALEEAYARAEVTVVSNNSACRILPDVPVLIPEVNGAHLEVLSAQRARLGTKRGCILCKPNCSVQSYLPALTPLLPFGITDVSVCTYQAVSGAGKRLSDWGEIADNVIPYIAGEEEKSEREPLKIWGWVEDGRILPVWEPRISAQCVRVGVSDGHTACVNVKFRHRPTREEILSAWESYAPIDGMALPHAPKRFLTYLEEADRPQPRLDRDREGGMGITVGRLRPDPVFDWKFVCLSHNTLRGAAGGAVLMAEYYTAKAFP